MELSRRRKKERKKERKRKNEEEEEEDKKVVGAGVGMNKKERSREKQKKKKKRKLVELTTQKLWAPQSPKFTMVPLSYVSQFLKTPNSCFLFPSLYLSFLQ